MPGLPAEWSIAGASIRLATDAVASYVSNPTTRKAFALGLAVGTFAFLGAIFVWMAFMFLFSETGIIRAPGSKRRQKPDGTMVEDYPGQERDQISNRNEATRWAALFVGGSAGSAVEVGNIITSNVFSTFISWALVLYGTAPLVVFIMLGIVFTFFSDLVMGQVNHAYRFAYTYFAGFLLIPLGTLAVLLYQAALGVLIDVFKMMAALINLPALDLIECSIQQIPQLAGTFVTMLNELLNAIWYVINNNIFFTEFPIYNFIQQVQRFIFQVATGPVRCACELVNELTMGLLIAINDPSLTKVVYAAVNLPFEILFRWIAVPIILAVQGVVNPYPSVTRANTLTVQIEEGTGDFVQFFFTNFFDLILYGGNGTFVAYVYRLIPPPTDDFAYVVRLFQFKYANAILETFGFFLVAFYEVMNIIFNIPNLPTPSGNLVFSFDITLGQAVRLSNSVQSGFNIVPNCTNAGFTNVPWGDAVTQSGMTIAYYAKIVLDNFIGEIYSAVYSEKVFGWYLENYLLTNAPPLLWFQGAVERASISIACGLGYISPAFAVSAAGLIQAIVIWLFRVPVEILAYIRTSLQDGNVTVFDSVSIFQQTQALENATKFGEIFYQLDPSGQANEQTCNQTISFPCATGNAAHLLPTAFVNIFTVAEQTIINLLKVTISGLKTNTIAKVKTPDFQVIVNDYYGFTCNAGVAIMTLIPFDIPCMKNQGTGFCSVKEFPVIPETTVGNCFATTGCKLGNLFLLGWVVDGVGQFLAFLTSFNYGENAIISIFSAIFNIVVYKMLSFPCPLAHALDCVIDSVLQTGETAVSDFVCLFTEALVVILRSLGDITLAVLKLTLDLVMLFLGPTGDIAHQLVNIFSEMFNVLSTSLGEIVMAFIDLALSALIDALVTICDIVLFYDLQVCDAFKNTTNTALQNAGLSLNTPENINYRKRQVQENKQACDAHAKSIWRKDLVQFIDGRIAAAGKLEKTRKTWSDIRGKLLGEHRGGRKRDGQAIGYQFFDAIWERFGTGPEEPKDIISYLARNVTWTPGTACYTLVSKLDARGDTIDTVGIAEGILLDDCLLRYVTMVSAKGSFPILSFIPDDLLYNPIQRSLMMGINAARFAEVALQYASDQSFPASKIFSAEYQLKWAMLSLDVSFYNTTWKPYYDAAVIKTNPDGSVELDQALFAGYLVVVRNRTLDDYMMANFPDAYATNVETGEPMRVDSVIYQATRFGLDFLFNAFDAAHNRSLHITSANETIYVIPNGSPDAYANSTTPGTATDEAARSATSEYKIRTSFLAGLSNIFMKLREIFQRGADSYHTFKRTLADSPRFVSSGSRMVWLLRETIAKFPENYERLAAIGRRRASASLENFYKNSPVFHMADDVPSSANATIKRSVTGEFSTFVAQVTSAGANLLGVEPETIPPAWCLRMINLNLFPRWTYQQVVHYATNDTSLVRRCKDPAWVKRLRQHQPHEAAINPKAWIAKLLAPRNQRAQEYRDFVYSTGRVFANTAWKTYYIMFGSDDPEAPTFFKRNALVVKGTEPTFQQYQKRSIEPKRVSGDESATNKPAATPHVTTIHETERPEQHKYDLWQMQNLPLLHKYVKNPGSVSFGEVQSEVASFFGVNWNDNPREELGKLATELYMQHIDRELFQAAGGDLSKVRPRSDYFKMKFETMAHSKRNDVDPLYPPFNYTTLLLEMQCSSGDAELCKLCYVLDQIYGVAFKQQAALVVYYTLRFPPIANTLIEYVNYTYNPAAPARSGITPVFPALGRPDASLGRYLGLSDEEILHGIDVTKWIRVALDSSYPTWQLYYNGPYFQKVLAYTNARRTVGSNVTISLPLELASYIQFNWEFNICAYVDTLGQFSVGNSITSTIRYVEDHVLFCDALLSMDGSLRSYSVSGGIINTGFWWGALSIGTQLVFGTSMTGLMIQGGLATFFPLYFFPVTTYGWSVRCALPPIPTVYELWLFATHVVVPPCHPIIGAFVKNDTWSPTTCLLTNVTWDMLNVFDSGPWTIFDIAQYFRLYYASPQGIYAIPNFVVNFADFIAPYYAIAWSTSNYTMDFSAYNQPVQKAANLWVSAHIWAAINMGLTAILVLLGMTLFYQTQYTLRALAIVAIQFLILSMPLLSIVLENILTNIIIPSSIDDI